MSLARARFGSTVGFFFLQEFHCPTPSLRIAKCFALAMRQLLDFCFQFSLTDNQVLT